MNTSNDPVGSSIVKEFSVLPTTAVGAALEKLGIAGRCAGLAPMDGTAAPLCGRVFTVQFLPCGAPDGRTPNGGLGDYLQDVPPGYVLVLDNRGDHSLAVWDGELARIAALGGIAGTVIDGACSDLAQDAGSLPVFARAKQTLNGKDRVRVESLNLPVAIGAVRVECDDIVLGDGEGLVVVPRDHLRAVLAEARALSQTGGH